MTVAQQAALAALDALIAVDGPNARLPYGPGTERGITRSTASALRRLGLVELHSHVHARPSRAGFGRAANERTVLTSDLWMTRRA